MINLTQVKKWANYWSDLKKTMMVQYCFKFQFNFNSWLTQSLYFWLMNFVLLILYWTNCYFVVFEIDALSVMNFDFVEQCYLLKNYHHLFLFLPRSFCIWTIANFTIDYWSVITHKLHWKYFKGFIILLKEVSLLESWLNYCSFHLWIRSCSLVKLPHSYFNLQLKLPVNCFAG